MAQGHMPRRLIEKPTLELGSRVGIDQVDHVVHLSAACWQFDELTRTVAGVTACCVTGACRAAVGCSPRVPAASTHPRTVAASRGTAGALVARGTSRRVSCVGRTTNERQCHHPTEPQTTQN